MNKKLFFQLFRFSLVGLAGAIVQFSVVIFLVEFFKMRPVIANIYAFIMALIVVYLGHQFWTFKDTPVRHHTAVPRLLFLSICNFIANEGLFYIFLTVFHLTYYVALFWVLAILPLLTFIINKYWVFR